MEGNKGLELDKLLELFKFLSSPFEGSGINLSVTTPFTSPSAVFENITEFCLKHVEFLESSQSILNNEEASAVTESTSSWKFTCLVLSMLLKLKTSMEQVEAEQTEEEKSIEVLSIQFQILVQKSVELVIGFGVVPYLLPGLGVPPKLRKMNPSVSYFLSEINTISPYEQFLRLGHTLEILLICSTHQTLNSLICQKYTSDILAGLLQICKAPIVRPKPFQHNLQKPGALSLEQYEKVVKVREQLSVLMTDIFKVCVSKTVLINSLFLIGAAEKPRWISISCNDILCDIILSENGLLAVSSTMLDVSGSSDSWKLMRIISNLMRTAVVKSSNNLNRLNLQALAKQCLQMVNQNQNVETHKESSGQREGKSDIKSASLKLLHGTSVELIHIGLFCGLTLMEIDFEFGKSIFWDRLFRHVVHLNTCQNDENVDIISSTEKSSIDVLNSFKVSSSISIVAMSIVHIELLLSLVKPMNVCLPLKRLQPVWSLLVQIFVACKIYLNKPVQEPNVAAVAEQLHHKLKDVLILLFEIYWSSSGENLVLVNSNPATTTTSADFSSSSNSTRSETNAKGREQGKKDSRNLCDFIMMLVLNQESNGVSTLNTFDLLCNENEDNKDGQPEVQLIQVHQEIISESSSYSEVYENYLDRICACLSSEILKNERLKNTWATLFRQLLSWGTRRHDSGSGHRMHKAFKSDKLPTYLEGTDDLKVSLSECQKFVTFKLLGELGDEEKILEQFGSSESMEETLSFLELLLNKFADEASSDSNSAFDASQLIMYALGIIGALIEAAAASVATVLSSQCAGSNQSSFTESQINKELNEMWKNLEMFIPHLRKLSQCTQPSLVRQGVPEMASGLLLSIATRGIHRSGKKETDFPLKTRFQQALENSSSPMVHVKGHGILELRRLIEQKDNETLKNEVQLLKLFRENVCNDDSYVYLMSIQGMASLAIKFHKAVVPVLIKEYDFINCGDDNNDEENSDCSFGRKRNMHQELDSNERMETRMKVGEILVKVVQKLNELAPSYRVPLTNVFFRLMRDEEPLIRASALSNLGELCHLLKFSLGNVLTEVWFCVQSILSSEKDIHVRRAALHLLALLLKGVQKDLSVEDILSDTAISTHLRDVRRLLTRVEQSEVDLVAKTHCQLALQELEMIVKKLLTPNNSLNYKIQILNL